MFKNILLVGYNYRPTVRSILPTGKYLSILLLEKTLLSQTLGIFLECKTVGFVFCIGRKTHILPNTTTGPPPLRSPGGVGIPYPQKPL